LARLPPRPDLVPEFRFSFPVLFWALPLEGDSPTSSHVRVMRRQSLLLGGSQTPYRPFDSVSPPFSAHRYFFFVGIFFCESLLGPGRHLFLVILLVLISLCPSHLSIEEGGNSEERIAVARSRVVSSGHLFPLPPSFLHLPGFASLLMQRLSS